jgi:SAM-dependent methyltransferase
MRDRPAFDLFLISWLVLFLELACIRWFPSHVLFLTFFVNLVLLACFVGMSIGCLVARRRTNFIRHTPYWLLLGLVLGLVTNVFSDFLRSVFAVGNQAKPDVVYFGTETSITLSNPLPFNVPMELVGALYFGLIAAIMVGPGQEMGRAFNRVPNRTTAYSANLLGSLVGIAMFAGCSFLRLPPIVWFGLSGIVLAYLLIRKDPDAAPEVREALPPSVTGVTTPAAPHLSPAPAPAGRPLLPLACLFTAVVLTAATSGIVTTETRETIWSEYYRIDYQKQRKFINTNLISQQLIEPRSHPPLAAVPYALPYMFQRDLKKPDGAPAWPEFKKVLIIGAGNGNDVARALLFLPKDAEVDAVEIDPVIQKLGELHHPDRPFQDPRVRAHINDGRNFLRVAKPETYDLVVFALIDSLVLQSGYSNLRLESYLFTIESFRDVRRVLKPTGVCAIYNFFRQGWIAARIHEQIKVAFNGVEPVAIVTPPQREVRLDEFRNDSSTAFFAGTAEVVEPLRAAFAPQGGKRVKYWYPWHTGIEQEMDPKEDVRFKARFDTEPPLAPPRRSPVQHEFLRHFYVKDEEGRDTDEPIIDPATGQHKVGPLEPEWIGLFPAKMPDVGNMRLADDNWPFLYTREPSIPGLTWRSVLLTLLMSVGLWAAFGGRKALASEAGVKPDYGMMLRAFFLGAGFMLVETKAVVEMALLFGGTWMVNTAVFAAILVMSLAGNLFAGWAKPKRLEPYYAGLFATLAIGLAVSPSAFLGYNPTVQIVGACLLVFAPIAFAGVVFATSFRRTAQPDRVFGANVAGALVGGLAENTSVILGFQLLLCVAVGFYLLSAVFGNREVPDSAADQSV